MDNTQLQKVAKRKGILLTTNQEIENYRKKFQDAIRRQQLLQKRERERKQMEKDLKGGQFKAKKIPANLNTSKTLHDITLKGNLSINKSISDKKPRCPIKLNRLLKG